MSVYKEPINWLRESVGSILSQTFTDFEFIIILDNPKYEEGLLYLREIERKDNRIKLFLNSENLGLTRSLNVGLREANGKYIARMDADDISLLDRFQKQFDFMEKRSDIIVCGGGITRIGGRNDDTFYEPDPENIFLYFTYPNPYLSPFAHPTVLIRRNVLELYNIRYNEEFITAQDYGLWNELIFKGKFSNLDQILLKYRTSDSQVSKQKGVDQIINTEIIVLDHIKRWLDINNIKVNEEINPYFLVKFLKRDSVCKQYNLKITAMVYGLLMNRKYRFWYAFGVFIFHPALEVSLKLKIKLLAKKVLKR